APSSSKDNKADKVRPRKAVQARGAQVRAAQVRAGQVRAGQVAKVSRSSLAGQARAAIRNSNRDSKADLARPDLDKADQVKDQEDRASPSSLASRVLPERRDNRVYPDSRVAPDKAELDKADQVKDQEVRVSLSNLASRLPAARRDNRDFLDNKVFPSKG